MLCRAGRLPRRTLAQGAGAARGHAGGRRRRLAVPVPSRSSRSLPRMFLLRLLEETES